MLSGYADGGEYERRDPSWEPSGTFPSVEAATESGFAWLADQSEQALVEVIGSTPSAGHVLRIIEDNGIEDIAPPSR